MRPGVSIISNDAGLDPEQADRRDFGLACTEGEAPVSVGSKDDLKHRIRFKSRRVDRPDRTVVKGRIARSRLRPRPYAWVTFIELGDARHTILVIDGPRFQPQALHTHHPHALIRAGQKPRLATKMARDVGVCHARMIRGLGHPRRVDGGALAYDIRSARTRRRSAQTDHAVINGSTSSPAISKSSPVLNPTNARGAKGHVSAIPINTDTATVSRSAQRRSRKTSMRSVLSLHESVESTDPPFTRSPRAHRQRRGPSWGKQADGGRQ
jgi:hypothetical protein